MATYSVTFHYSDTVALKQGTIDMDPSGDPVAALISAGMASPDNHGLEIGDWGGQIEIYAGAGRVLWTLTPC